jgi:predicted transcriptional regulator
MRMNWIALAVAAVLVVGCGAGAEKKDAAKAAKRQQEWSQVEALKASVDAKRAELASLKSEAAGGADVSAQIDATGKEVNQLTDELTGKIAAYINEDPPVEGEPMRPDLLPAVRMNSAEGMLVAREYIDLGGDYRKAIDIYNQLLGLDPDNADLKAALADAEAGRFMTEDRFAAVKKGMSEDEVVAAIGRPLTRNVKDYPAKKITAWFYPKDDEGNAAGVFYQMQKDKEVVYKADFNFVKAKKPGEEGGGAGDEDNAPE